jgi:hypothetical protein
MGVEKAGRGDKSECGGMTRTQRKKSSEIRMMRDPPGILAAYRIGRRSIFDRASDSRPSPERGRFLTMEG